MSYRVFTRTWWKPNPRWPDGREPGAGRKSTLPGCTRIATVEEAREICRLWNAEHNEGHLSRRAEFEEN